MGFRNVAWRFCGRLWCQTLVPDTCVSRLWYASSYNFLFALARNKAAFYLAQNVYGKKFFATNRTLLYFAQVCTRTCRNLHHSKNLREKSMSDVKVFCSSFLSVCHGHKGSNSNCCYCAAHVTCDTWPIVHTGVDISLQWKMKTRRIRSALSNLGQPRCRGPPHQKQRTTLSRIAIRFFKLTLWRITSCIIDWLIDVGWQATHIFINFYLLIF